jgi:competence protein ComEA
MPRHGRTAGTDDRSTANARLAALRLDAPVSGWVPTPDADAGPEVGDDRLTLPPEPAVPVQSPAEAASVPSPGTLLRGWLADRAPLWAQPAVERLGSGAVWAVALVVAVVIGVVVLHHRGAAGYSTSYDASATAPFQDPSAASSVSPDTGAGDPSADGASIVVDVGGRVRKPGLVTLPAGARVADAIAAAGGPVRHHEIARLDLAARVTDGQLLLIGVAATAGGGPSAASPADPADPTESSPAVVDLNSATIDQLETLPRVGPVTAQKIIDWRTAHSGFTSVEQLQQVSGIGPATYSELAPLVMP